jgi:hypothetical protein
MISPETLRQRVHDSSVLRSYWQSVIDEYLPSLSQFNRWVTQYTSNVVEFGITRTSVKACKMRTDGAPMSADHLVRYASGCMSNKRRESQEQVVANG